MKFSTALFALSSSAVVTHAFPTLNAGSFNGLTPEKLNAAIRTVEKFKQEKRFLVDITKPIDITGEHAFKAPSGNDQRGPCPGLNALANHGYISRTGVTSFAEVVAAINKVMGMGTELSLILGIMGTVWVGNPLSLNPGFSIGGPPPASGGLLGGITEVVAGKSRGLYGAHNWLEADASLTRNDLYVTGNAWTMNMSLFLDVHNRADSNGVISMDLIAEQAARRFEDSVATNPNFYYGPLTGTISRNAGYLFLARLLSNHTADHPGGILTQDVFRKFFGVYQDARGNLEYREGHETIPENWYRKPVEYSLVALNLDIVSWVLKHPVLGSVGGNTGKVNTFTGLNLEDYTGGVFNAATLLENNNLVCFVLEFVKTFAPNSLSGLLSTIDVPLKLLLDIINTPLLSLACPAWKDLKEGGEPLWDALQHKFSGARKAGSSL